MLLGSRLASVDSMTRKLIQRLLVACGLVAIIAFAGTELYFVRDLLAALLMFFVSLVALAVVCLVSYFVGDVILRAVEFLGVRATSFRLRQPVPSSIGPLKHEIVYRSFASKLGACCTTSRSRSPPGWQIRRTKATQAYDPKSDLHIGSAVGMGD